MSRAVAARTVLALAVAVHLAVLYVPRAPSAGSLPWADTVVHVVVFAGVVWAGRAARVPAPLLLGLAVAHAPLSEAVQHWLLPDRTGDLLDVLADLGGVALGVVLPVRRRAGTMAG